MAGILQATEFLDLAIAGDVTTAVTGSLIGSVVDLYQNDLTPDRHTVVGDFVVANYDGYAQSAVTWLAASRADDGSIELVGTVPEFRPTGALVSNTIFGYFLRDGAGNLLASARDDLAPLPMGSTLDSILITVRVRITAGGLVSVVS